MPVDRNHAFATGPLRPVPDGELGLLRRVAARAVAVGLRVADALAFEAAVLSFARGAVHGAGLRVGPRAYCLNRAPRHHVVLGEGVVCRGVLRVEYPPGVIAIGDGAYVGDDVVISAADSVRIGAAAMLAHGVHVFDNDSHPIDPEVRRADRAAIFAGRRRPIEAVGHAPVDIGDGAWIGAGSFVMKGVRVGEGSIVAAGSVVVRDVPPRSLAAGNPARVLRALDEGERGG